MSVNQIALSTSHHQTFSSEEKGQVAPVESVESRVQKILSEIFGRDIAQIISVYHRLRNITSLSPITNGNGLKSIDLSCAQISNELLGQLSPDIDIINMNGSLFNECLNFSKFRQLKSIFADECPFEKINLRELPLGLEEISLEGSQFHDVGLHRFELRALRLSQYPLPRTDFSELCMLRALTLSHHREERCEADFSGLFDQLSRRHLDLLLLEIDGYVLKRADFSKLSSNIRRIVLRKTDLRKINRIRFPLFLEELVLDRCQLNRDSLIQLPQNLKKIHLIDCTLITVDLCHFPRNLESTIFERCIFGETIKIVPAKGTTTLIL